MNNIYHTPVLQNATIDNLKVSVGAWYVDATLGGAGHTDLILERGGFVLGIDQDQDSVDFVNEKYKSQSSKYTIGKEIIIENSNFANIQKIVERHKLIGKIDGILFDLGVSSFQIDKSGRGFSIRKDEKLDMRMGISQNLTAWEIVNTWSQNELIEIIQRFGEEENAVNIARVIVETRHEAKINTGQELAKIIEKKIKRNGLIHPATKTFQAIRITVNNELGVIDTGIRDAFEILNKNGRLCVITFHSLEDRIVKQKFRELTNKNLAQLVNRKPIVANSIEVQANRRARSAKLRVIEKM